MATISEVHILNEDERREAFTEIVNRGWLNQMRADVKEVKANLAELRNPTPDLIINVRFRPDDVRRYFPMPVFPQEHAVSSARRYQPIDWTESDLIPSIAAPGPKDRNRSGRAHLRAAQEATTVDPKHQRMQDDLLAALRRQHGKESVDDEFEFVDLRRRDSKGQIFYEIKTDTLARLCIRNALGQLFDYALYPAERKAHTWIVVGNVDANEDDVRFLAHIRRTFGIPLYYQKFDCEKKCLSECC